MEYVYIISVRKCMLLFSALIYQPVKADFLLHEKNIELRVKNN